MSVLHDRFTLERRLPVGPERAFDAFAEPSLKASWFALPDDWSDRLHELDFRVGGHETNRGRDTAGVLHEFRGRYHRIVRPREVVFSYELYLDDALVSVSLTTVELAPDADATVLTFTEQGAFFDGLDLTGGRQFGTNALLDRLVDTVTA